MASELDDDIRDYAGLALLHSTYSIKNADLRKCPELMGLIDILREFDAGLFPRGFCFPDLALVLRHCCSLCFQLLAYSRGRRITDVNYDIAVQDTLIVLNGLFAGLSSTIVVLLCTLPLYHERASSNTVKARDILERGAQVLVFELEKLREYIPPTFNLLKFHLQTLEGINACISICFKVSQGNYSIGKTASYKPIPTSWRKFRRQAVRKRYSDDSLKDLVKQPLALDNLHMFSKFSGEAISAVKRWWEHRKSPQIHARPLTLRKPLLPYIRRIKDEAEFGCNRVRLESLTEYVLENMVVPDDSTRKRVVLKFFRERRAVLITQRMIQAFAASERVGGEIIWYINCLMILQEVHWKNRGEVPFDLLSIGTLQSMIDTILGVTRSIRSDANVPINLPCYKDKAFNSTGIRIPLYKIRITQQAREAVKNKICRSNITESQSIAIMQELEISARDIASATMTLWCQFLSMNYIGTESQNQEELNSLDGTWAGKRGDFIGPRVPPQGGDKQKTPISGIADNVHEPDTVHYIPDPSAWMTLNRMKFAQRLFHSILELVGLVEEPIQIGHQRIRWKNERGKLLYGDYIEYERGALQALQGYLNRSGHRKKTNITSRQSNVYPSSGPSISFNGNTFQMGRSEFNNCARRRAQSDPHIRGSGNEVDLELGDLPIDTSHLLCCIEKGRFGKVLYQEPLTQIQDDQALFRMLRRLYYEHRGRYHSYLSLTTLQSIHFMMFEYKGHPYVNVRLHENICQQIPHGCMPSYLTAAGQEYRFVPRPVTYCPPLDTRTMMLFFSHPDEAPRNETFLRDRFPKRACGALPPRPSNEMEAWGIYFKDGWHWPKIIWIIILVYVVPSLMFGILWGTLKHDIQGSFGVASWCMAAATILIGICSMAP